MEADVDFYINFKPVNHTPLGVWYFDINSGIKYVSNIQLMFPKKHRQSLKKPVGVFFVVKESFFILAFFLYCSNILHISPKPKMKGEIWIWK